MARQQTRLRRLNIAEQVNIATPATSWTRTIPFSASERYNPIRENDRQADTLGRASLWGEQFRAVRTRNMAQLTIPNALDCNEFLLPCLTGLVGGVAGVQIQAGVDGYTWTFTPDMSGQARSDVDLYSVQRVESDVAAAATVRTAIIPKVYCEQFAITIADGGLITTSAQYRGGKVTDPGAAAQAGLTIRTPRSLCPKRISAAALYDSWAAAVAGAPGRAAIISGTITIPTGLTPTDDMENNPDLDYLSLDPSSVNATANLRIYAETGAASLEREELAHLEAADLRFLKVRLNSGRPALNLSGGATFQPGVDIIMSMTHTDDSIGSRGEADSANRGIVAMNLIGGADTVQVNGLQIVVRNEIATFPS